jgi:hypothetical protein
LKAGQRARVEHGSLRWIEPSGAMKDYKFLDELNDYKLLKKGSAG